MEIKNVKISDLKPHNKNPRIHPENAINKLARSIEEFGWTNPILCSKDGIVLAGHARLKAALKAGIKKVPVIYLPLEGAKADAYLIADNKLQDETDWDEVKLEDLFKELSLTDLDLSLTGFDEIEWDKLIGNNGNGGLTDPDSLPEEVEPICKTGDLWQLGRHRLLCDDCTVAENVERLMDGQKANMVFTDPPYGICYSGGRTQVVAKKHYGKIQGDENKDIGKFIKIIIQSAGNKDCYICLSPINLKYAIFELPKYEGVIIWKKQSPGLGYQWVRRYCEFIIFNTNRIKRKNDLSLFDFWEINRDNAINYEHGTQKPVELSEKAIKFSSVKDDIVLDIFGGSGSTLIACEQTNRICYMMEIDAHYCDIIINRWQNFTGGKAELIKKGNKSP